MAYLISNDNSGMLSGSGSLAPGLSAGYIGNTWSSQNTTPGLIQSSGPSLPNTLVQNYSGGGTNYTTRRRSGDSPAPAYNQADMDYLNDQTNRLKGLYGNIDATYNSGVTGIGDRYNKELGNLNLGHSRAVEDYNDNETKSEFGRSRELEKTDNSARSLADSLRQRIGLASGSGSSAYQITAPDAVAKDASGKRTGILEDYSFNFKDIAKKRRQEAEDYATSTSGLDESKKNWMSALESDTVSQRQSLDQQLADLEAEKGRLRGGSYASTRLNQQPYLDQYNARQATLNSLFDKYRTPVFSAKPVNVQKVNLRDYMTDKTRVVDSSQDATYDPYQNYLKNKEDENLLV